MQKFLPRILFGLLMFAGFIFLPTDVSAATTFQFPTMPPFPTIVIPTVNIPQYTRVTPQPTHSVSYPTPTRTSPTNSPTAKPTAVPTVKPSTTTAPTQAQASSLDEKKTFIMNAINDYRRSLGLYAVKTSAETCAFAAVRAKEITTGFNHDGFRNRINNKTIPYKTWTSVTENLAMTSNYKNVVNMWINSAGHAANMRKDTPFVCVESSGNYYAYEGMKP